MMRNSETGAGVFFLASLFPSAVVFLAASAAFAQPAGEAALTSSQLEGRRLVVQHCGICHLKIQINVAAPFAPVLSKASFENGRDAEIKAAIANGSPNMPGFKVMFTPQKIDAIADYLKTVNPPAAAVKR